MFILNIFFDLFSFMRRKFVFIEVGLFEKVQFVIVETQFIHRVYSRS